MTMNQIDFNQTKSAIHDFCERNRIQLLILFGSMATSAQHARSDVDIAVWNDKKISIPIIKLQYINELTDIFQADIDLALIHTNTDPVFLDEIFTKGTPLYEAQPGLFIDKKILAWKIYQDTQKLRDYRGQYIRNFVMSRRNHVNG